jgi:periplasmic protein TonB
MVERLVASGWQGGGLGRGTVLAIAVHAAALGVALRPRQTVAATPQVSPRVWLLTPPPEGVRVTIPVAPPIGPDIRIPGILSVEIPGILPGTAPTQIPGFPLAPSLPAQSPESVYDGATVDEAPELLSAPPPVYPELLRQAGVEGVVFVEAVVDTSGRVERGSLVVVSSADPAFDRGALECIGRALFRPARVGGRAVRVLVRLPVQFHLSHS